MIILVRKFWIEG